MVGFQSKRLGSVCTLCHSKNENQVYIMGSGVLLSVLLTHCNDCDLLEAMLSSENGCGCSVKTLFFRGEQLDMNHKMFERVMICSILYQWIDVAKSIDIGNSWIVRKKNDT